MTFTELQGWAAIVAFLGAVVFAAYSFRVLRLSGARAYGKGLARGTNTLIFAVVGAVAALGRAVGWLSKATEDEDGEKADEPWDLPGGSFFNHRTGRFDSGRDPAGHYAGLADDDE